MAHKSPISDAAFDSESKPPQGMGAGTYGDMGSRSHQVLTENIFSLLSYKMNTRLILSKSHCYFIRLNPRKKGTFK